ncbi:thioredoxin-2 [mine drainage metagenome]|uniref:Thioredoxin-2 n=1 Tax=mine drainage metagenome TaxID=410659 RepID=A0A1J5P2F4_9ZZZZ
MPETIHVVCVECNTTNRIPKIQDDKELNCGRCHQPLFGNAPRNQDAAGLKAQITKSQVPVVVDFWAPWCGPCKAMAPAFAQAAAAMTTKARFVKVNTEEQPALAAQYAIQSIPSMLIFRDGRELARRVGAISAHELVGWLNSMGVR